MTVAFTAASVASSHAVAADKASASAKKSGKSKSKIHKASMQAAVGDDGASAKVRKVVTVKGKRRVILVERGARAMRAAYVPAAPTLGEAMGLRATPDALALRSSVALVMDQGSGDVLFQKNASAVLADRFDYQADDRAGRDGHPPADGRAAGDHRR